MEGIPDSPRRRVLKRGAVLVGGLAGFGLLSRATTEAVTGVRAPESGALAFTIHGRNWQTTYPDRRRGVLPSPGERSTTFGQLFARAADAAGKVGEFYASAFAFGAPFGPSAVSAASMEMHQFNLADGTIVVMGTVASLTGGESVHAIIGGTGRYEGASGSYTARQSPVELGGDGTAEFSFTITLRSA